MSKCTLCHEKNHVFVSCEKVKIEGEKLHQELVNVIVRKSPYQSMGYFIETYLERLNVLNMDCIVAFHTKEVLQEYALQMHLREEITINQCSLETRKTIIYVLRFYYYNSIFDTGIFQSTDPVKNYSKLKTKVKPIPIPIQSQEKKTFDCPICYLEVEEKYCVITNCNHTICSDCFTSLEQHDVRKKPVCFYCRTHLKYVTFRDAEKREAFLSA